MEVGTFVEPAVAGVLENNFVEARLHVDDSRFLDLEFDLLGLISQPAYALVPYGENLDFEAEGFDPKQVNILARQDGATLGDPAPFVEFLEKGKP